jgi:ATP-dependent protease ClpP protease subunit
MTSHIKIFGMIDEKMVESVWEQVNNLEYDHENGTDILLCSDGGFASCAFALFNIFHKISTPYLNMKIIGHAMSRAAILALLFREKYKKFGEKSGELILMGNSSMYLHHSQKEIHALDRIDFHANYEEHKYYKEKCDLIIKKSDWLSKPHKDLYFNGKDVFITNENRLDCRCARV